MLFSTAHLVDIIRHGFECTDDSGVCEAVIGRPSRRPLAGGLCPDRFVRVDDDDDEHGHEEVESRSSSPDIPFEGVGSPRQRSKTNVGLQLELMRDSRLAKKTAPTVFWAAANAAADFDFSAIFPYRTWTTTNKKKEIVSATTQLLQRKGAGASLNPFSEFAKWEASETLSTGRRKQFVIYLPFVDKGKGEKDEQCGGGMSSSFEVIADLSGSKVFDLIGLCCFKYTSKNLEPPLRLVCLRFGVTGHLVFGANQDQPVSRRPSEVGTKIWKKSDGDITGYELCMADDEGDIEWDLPPLGKAEPLSRIGFRYLALIDRVGRTSSSRRESLSNRVEEHKQAPTYQITVQFSNGRVHTLHYETLADVTVKQVRDDAMALHRPTIQLPLGCAALAGAEYVIENLDNDDSKSEGPLPLTSSILETHTTRFYCLRKNSKRPQHSSASEATSTSSPPTRMHTLSVATTKSVSVDSPPSYSLLPLLVVPVLILRRLKSNYHATLTVRVESLELVAEKAVRAPRRFAVPTNRHRRTASTTSATKQKVYSIPIDRLGAIEVLDDKSTVVGKKQFRLHYRKASHERTSALRSGKRRGSFVWGWAAAGTAAATQQQQDETAEHVAGWKSRLLEADASMVDQLATLLDDSLLVSNDSACRQAYLNPVAVSFHSSSMDRSFYP